MSSETSFGLSLKTIEMLKSVFFKHSEVEKVLIYGSRAKGNYKAGSDIDLTMIGPKLTVQGLLRIETEIEQLMLPYKVDLSAFEGIENPDLVDHIKRVGKVFYVRKRGQ